MYNAFFHFREAPFSITPDPAFLYLSPHHHEALAHLLYGTGESGGFVLLTGEVGTGKTTVVRTLLEQKLDDVDLALILNPRQSVVEFLHSLFDELGLPAPEGGADGQPASTKPFVDQLNRHLLDAHARGRRTVLIIDEAQNLSEELLEQIRLLTNLETHKQKLLRIMLIGQPELAELLARPSLRQLAQRITARFHLTALSADETSEYIAHRLRVVGGDAEVIDPAARRAVHRASGGIPRLINVLCDRALLAAYSAGTRHVTARMVREAAREVTPDATPSLRWPQGWRPGWIPGVAALGIVAAAAAWSGLQDGNRQAPAAAGSAEADRSARAETDDAAAKEAAAADAAAGEAPASAPLAVLSEPALPQPLPPEAGPAALNSVETLLSGLPPLADQLAVLLGLWDEAVTITAGENLCAQIAEVQLQCLRGQGDWSTLLRYDRPAILTLISARGDRHYLLLRHADQDRLTALWQDELRTVSRQMVDLLWNGDYFLVWRNSGPEEVLREGQRGEDVIWLRQALAAAAGDPLLGAPEPRFDADLRRRVEAFQRRNALASDGQVGERTVLMLMHSVAPEDPRLRPSRRADRG